MRIAVARYKAREPWTAISGYAGSGKSTLIKFIISALDVDPEEDVCYIAFKNAAEASAVSGIKVYAVRDMRSLVDHLNGTAPMSPTLLDEQGFFALGEVREFPEEKGEGVALAIKPIKMFLAG